MRWDSPLVLALAGTAAVHLVIITAGDALVVIHPRRPWIAAPHVELVEIEVPPVIKPLPPPPPAAVPPPPAPVEPVAPRPAPRAHAARAVASPPRAPEPPPPPSPSEPQTPSGGEPVVRMDDVAPAATGVAVAVGKPVTGRIGRGGSGGGTGASTGSGAGDEVARPASVATIKIDAQPKGDYSYDGIGKGYPAEAIALGVEGDLRVQMVIDVNGKVVSRRLLNRLGHGLDEIAMKRAAEMEFTPAIDTDGHVVSQRIVWTFHMKLPK